MIDFPTGKPIHQAIEKPLELGSKGFFLTGLSHPEIALYSPQIKTRISSLFITMTSSELLTS